MSDCCHALYDEAFDAETAKKELKNYLSSGVKKSSRTIAEAVRDLPLDGYTMLDIGGGIGTLIFESFQNGISQAVHVDISKAYRQVFQEEAGRRGLRERVETYHGDFLDFEQSIPAADLVTLDKVICCYLDYPVLVKASVAKAHRWYVYSIPRDVWWVKLVHGFGVWLHRLKGKRFRSYIHPAEKIEQLVRQGGFKKIRQSYQREWLIVVFEKEQ